MFDKATVAVETNISPEKIIFIKSKAKQVTEIKSV